MARRPTRKSGSGKRKPSEGERRPRNGPVQRPSDTGDEAYRSPREPQARFPIVGIGASAGGLEAFSQLLAALPAEPGVSIILIQHLAPQHASALPTLLAGVSRLPVVEAAEGMRVEPNTVYVIPPNVQMGITDDVLHLNPRPSDRTQYTPLDFFLRCLAESAQDRAIAVVLSGTASDGAVGVRDVKAGGGITFAQRPDTAKYDGMPRAAIATGMVDLVLSPTEIGAELVRLAQHTLRSADPARPPGPEGIGPAQKDALTRIFALLRAATGVDFRHYKLPTIMRRLQRRMAVQKLTDLDRYLHYLEDTPAEITLLYQDILIHVTRFFREPTSFEALTFEVVPKLVAGRNPDAPLRIWVCGCATGEEAYSVAIALLEYVGDNGRAVPIQIFATDVSESAIEVAREGLYPGSIDGDVSPERLRRFFVEVDGGYRIGKTVRDLCVFARQDLTRDPPFSKLDLILCRNVLIYMDANLQRNLMAVFHYALKSSGFLMLGHAETIGANVDLFSVVDKKHRIYAKQAVEVPVVRFPAEHAPSARRPIGREAGRAETGTASVRHEANRVVLDRFAPPGVVVDSDFHVVQFRGQTGRYLEPAPGDPSLSLLKMAREGLVFGLRAALQAARKDNRAVSRTGLTVRSNGGWRSVDLDVIPLKVHERTHYVVVFQEPADGEAKSSGKRAPRKESRRGDPRVVALEQELAASREHLQSIIQDLEAANEELQSANEEILSSNEELQSTNEELDTAKEELQSTNEELNTLNEELHGRNDELARVNSDLLNLLGSVEIAIVIVASDLRIRRFTPMAERVLNLLPGDVGRPIGHVKPNIDCPDLEMLIIDTVDRVVVTEREVRDQHGNWFSLRVRPYKNTENEVDGAVLALFDIGLAKRHEEELRQTRDFAEALHECLPHPMVVVDQRFRVHSVNRAFSETFGVPRKDAEGRGFFELPLDGWDLRLLRREIEPRVRDGGDIDPLLLEHEIPGSEGRRLRITGRRVAAASADGPFTVLALEDLSPRSDAGPAADDGADA